MQEKELTKSPMIEFFHEKGTRIEAAGNRQMELWHEDAVCLLVSGHLDFFITRLSGDQKPRGALHWCHTIEAEGIFFCDSAMHEEIGLLARGVRQSVVLKVSRADFESAMSRLESSEKWIARHLDNWARGLSSNLAPACTKKTDHYFKTGDTSHEIAAPQAFTFSMANKHAAWIKVPDSPATFRLADILDVKTAAADYVPVTPELWYELETQEPVVLSFSSADEIIGSIQAWNFLTSFHNFFSLAAIARLEQILKADQNQHDARKKVDDRVWKIALAHLAAVIGRQKKPADIMTGDDALFDACSTAGNAMGITFVRPEAMPGDESLHQRILLLSRASAVRAHKVKLTGSWYTRELTPMVAFLEEDDLPVALVPAGKRGCKIIYPDGRGQETMTAELAKTLQSHAYMFFKTLPDQKLTRKDLIRIGLGECRNEIRIILIAGFCAGLISLIVPVATNKVISDVIPGNHYNYLYQIMLGLIAAAVGSTLFELFKAVALLRTNFRAESRIQPAVWDRLLKLPVPFFNTANAGDLSNRANSIMEVTNQIKGTVIITAMSGIFASVNFFVMFHFHKKLALCALLMVIFALGFILFVGRMQFRAAHTLYDLQGKISGLVLQLTTGIAKLKTAGAEWRAYERWAKMFADQKHVDIKSRKYVVWQQTFSKAYDPLSKMLIIALLVFQWKGALTPGQYTAFNTAMGAFVVAVLSLGTVMEYLSGIFLLFNRVEPIISAEPEKNLVKAHPGELSGQVEVNNVRFSYQENGPEILKGVSMEANPGEFIAIVGGSGSGKSTLFRLLLGFETPDSGGIFYDGQDLAQLDLDSVRHQMGVVLQNGSLMPGDIFTNIVGASQLGIDDAWRAARRAGMEKDIKAMSMGMFTVVSENAGTFSGGQRQRLMIARALVNEPRLLLFDEATSALDNTTQAIVSRSVEELNVTRIVIAHRLSTIINADRIYVLENGQIVQTGNYETLIEKQGPFRDQALRQMI